MDREQQVWGKGFTTGKIFVGDTSKVAAIYDKDGNQFNKHHISDE